MDHSIMHLLDRAIYFLFFIPFIALPFLGYNWFRYMRSIRPGLSATRPFPMVSVLLFAAPIATVMAAGAMIAAAARGEVVDYLDGLESAEVSINGKAVADPAPVLAAVRSMSWIMAHHSHPTTRIQVVITSKKGRLSLDLGRDSGRPREYWVFYSGYRSTQSNEISRIVSDVFDAY